MALYKKPRYEYFPGDAQVINQEAEAEAEIENENRNETDNEQKQIEQNVSTIIQKAQNVNINGAGPAQTVGITQATGSDTTTSTPTQTATQTTDDTVVAAAVPVNTGDQTINE